MSPHSQSLKQVLLSILQKFGLDGAKPLSTPLASGSFMSTTDGVLLTNPSHYRCLVGSLQYLTLTKPDISFAVHHVCSFMQTPHDTHLIVVNKKDFSVSEEDTQCWTSLHSHSCS